jgi:L-iditol 2-dehydrogenase
MIRAAVMPGPNKPVELRELPDPVVPEGGILLATIASEVCGTDVHLHHGRLADVPWPIIPGHVSVGRVLEAPGVTADALGAPLAPGDTVTFYDVFGVCGHCWHCAVARQPNRCPARRVYGITTSADDGPFGGWAERILLQPGMQVVKLPETLDADTVIGGGCGLVTGFAAVERSDLAMGASVVVQGTGPVGLSAAAFARLRGADQVLSIGAPAERCALAVRFGADEALDLGQMSPHAREARVRAATGGRGADVVIEATGNPDAVPEGLRLLRDGGTYVVAGHYTDRGTATINPHVDVTRKHADIRGQWGTEFSHVVRALALLARHRDRLPFAETIGGRYGLAEAGRALADVEALRVTKAIIVP